MTFLARALVCFLEVRATAPRDSSFPVDVGCGAGGATGVCWATAAKIRSAKTDAPESKPRRKPVQIDERMATLESYPADQTGKR